jgi:hypothetical protein
MLEEREVKGEDEVVFGTIGAVVVFADVEEVKAHMTLFEGTVGAREKGAHVLDVDGCGVKTTAPLLADR